MKRSVPLILLVTLLGAALPLWAADEEVAPTAEADTAPAADESATTAGDTSASAAEDSTPGTLAADDTFIPTVEISEDLSVSFPADI